MPLRIGSTIGGRTIAARMPRMILAPFDRPGLAGRGTGAGSGGVTGGGVDQGSYGLGCSHGVGGGGSFQAMRSTLPPTGDAEPPQTGETGTSCKRANVCAHNWPMPELLILPAGALPRDPEIPVYVAGTPVGRMNAPIGPKCVGCSATDRARFDAPRPFLCTLCARSSRSHASTSERLYSRQPEPDGRIIPPAV